MKKITMKKITYTIVGIVAVFVLVLGVQSTQAQFKGAGSTSNQRLLTIEGTGENSTSQIAGLEIAPKSDTDKAYRSILNSQAQTFVNTRGGSIRILGTALFNLLTGLQNAELKKSGPGKLNIGYATAPTTNHADLQVSGSIRADGLTKASNLNGDKEPLCVTDFGVLERCDTTTLPLVNVCFEYTATHYTSQPASNDPTGCLAGTYTNATDDADNWNWTCTNGSDVTDCSAPKIPSRLNGKCEVYPYTYGTEPTTVGSAETIDQTHKACISGTYQDVTTGETTEWKWNCLGITENSMTGSTASCTASK